MCICIHLYLGPCVHRCIYLFQCVCCVCVRVVCCVLCVVCVLCVLYCACCMCACCVCCVLCVLCVCVCCVLKCAAMSSAPALSRIGSQEAAAAPRNKMLRVMWLLLFLHGGELFKFRTETPSSPLADVTTFVCPKPLNCSRRGNMTRDITVSGSENQGRT